MEFHKSKNPTTLCPKFYQQLISSSTNFSVIISPLKNPIANGNNYPNIEINKNFNTIETINCNICGSSVTNQVSEDGVQKIRCEDVKLLKNMLEFEVNFRKVCLSCKSSLIKLLKMKKNVNRMMRRIDSAIKCIKYVRKSKDKTDLPHYSDERDDVHLHPNNQLDIDFKIEPTDNEENLEINRQEKTQETSNSLPTSHENLQIKTEIYDNYEVSRIAEQYEQNENRMENELPTPLFPMDGIKVEEIEVTPLIIKDESIIEDVNWYHFNDESNFNLDLSNSCHLLNNQKMSPLPQENMTISDNSDEDGTGIRTTKIKSFNDKSPWQKQTIYNCTICSRKFNSKIKFIYHQKNYIHSEKLWKCERCPKRLTHYNKIINHMIKRHNYTNINECQHQDEDIFVYTCPECLVKFSDEIYFKSHTKYYQHSEKRWKCEILGCSELFLTYTLMKSHVESVHKNKQNFKCDTCDDTFNSKAGLEHHFKGKHLRKCPECEETFFNSVSKIKHMRLKHWKRKSTE